MKLTDPVIKAAKPKEKPYLLPDGHWTCITDATFRRQMVVLQVPIQSCFRLLLLRFVFVLGGCRVNQWINCPHTLLLAIKKIESHGALNIARAQSSGRYKAFRCLNPAKKTNYARLDQKELPELLRKIDQYDGQLLTRLALQLMALTFVSTSELWYVLFAHFLYSSFW